MIIVDASVAFKWFSLEEEYREQALQLLTKHLEKKIPILVPDLFFYELANAWATKVLLPLDQTHDYLNNLKTFQLQIVPMTFMLLDKAVDFSKQYNVSVYDASYAVLAEEKGCQLITADKKFVKHAHLKYIKLLQKL